MKKSKPLTNLQKFSASMKDINERLAAISQRTYQMARAGTGNLSNAEFRDLMKVHGQLTKAAEELMEKFANIEPDAEA